MRNRNLNRNITLGLSLSLAVISSFSIAQNLGKKAKIGNGLYQIVYSEKSNALYVAGIGRRGTEEKAKVYKVDPKTLAVTATIDVADAPAFGLGLNEKTQTLYTSNTRSNSVSAIDLKTNKVVATITNGKESSHTREVLVDETTNKVYVSNMSDVWVIDGATNKFSHHIEGLGERITGVSVNTVKQLLYVTSMMGQVSVVDLKTNKVVSSFPSGGKTPINIMFEPKSKQLFVVNQGSGDLTVLDESGKLLHTVPTGEGALSLNYIPSKKRILVANRTAGTTTVIDSGTYKVIANIKTGTFPQTIAVDQKTGIAYVTNKAASQPRNTTGATTAPVEDANGDIITTIEP